MKVDAYGLRKLCAAALAVDENADIELVGSMGYVYAAADPDPAQAEALRVARDLCGLAKVHTRWREPVELAR